MNEKFSEKRNFCENFLYNLNRENFLQIKIKKNRKIFLNKNLIFLFSIKMKFFIEITFSIKSQIQFEYYTFFFLENISFSKKKKYFLKYIF